MSFSLSILGGDARLKYMSEYLQDFDKKEDFFDDCDILVCPVPFSKDKIHITGTDVRIDSLFEVPENRKLPKLIAGGNLPEEFQTAMQSRNVTVWDFMKDPLFVEENAKLTAEGLLKSIIEYTDFSIDHAKILISGYGRCGKHIAKKLTALGGSVSVYDNHPTAILGAKTAGYPFVDINYSESTISDFDMIINTVPVPIFKAPFLRKMNSHCVCFETASAPGGFDEDICQGLAINVIRCPGIPGKTSPKSAGISLAESLLRIAIPTLCSNYHIERI